MSDTSGAPSGRRRRGGAVTTTACTECRKKRSKCDGLEPCSRCVTQKTTCIYEIPVKQSKDDMRKKIEDLEKHKENSETVLVALTAGDRQDELLRRLRSSDTLEDIAKWVESEETDTKKGFKTAFATDLAKNAIRNALASTISDEHQGAFLSNDSEEQGNKANEIPNNLQFPLQIQTGEQQLADFARAQRPLIGAWSRTPSSTTIQTARARGQNVLLGATYMPEYGTDPERIPPSWTKVTPNVELVEHLMALYFCWEFPTFAPLQMSAFMNDFRSHRPRYCSPLLVNAMLALGSRFSDLPDVKGEQDDPHSKGDRFFEEARRLLNSARSLNNLTSIQALGLMSLRQASCGQDTESYYYCGMAIRIAVEMGLHHDDVHCDDEEREVRRATFWGSFTLDQCWSLQLSKSPHLSFSVDFPPKPSIIPSSESAAWVPYTDQGAPLLVSAEQPSNVHSVFLCFCELAQRIHHGMYRLYSPQKQLTANTLVEVYTSYLSWYDSMPDVLKLGYNFTPSVLFCHLYYHHIILTTFLPFLHLRLTHSSIDPRSIVSEAATNITALGGVYNKLYTLQRTPSMTPFIVLVATIAHLTSLTDASSPTYESNLQKLRQGLQDLHDMSACHKFALRALDIVRYLALDWDIDVPSDIFPGQKSAKEVQQTVQPEGNSTNLFVPEEALFRGQTSGKTLFSIFPLQGVPLLGKGGMELDGFEVVDEEGRARLSGGGRRARQEEKAEGEGTGKGKGKEEEKHPVGGRQGGADVDMTG